VVWVTLWRRQRKFDKSIGYCRDLADSLSAKPCSYLIDITILFRHTARYALASALAWIKALFFVDAGFRLASI
jgi:hypothetical protein